MESSASPQSNGRMAPIQRQHQHLADVAYERVLEAIRSGVLAQGEPVVIGRLAEELGVSRTPVRDAILRLQQEGLVYANGYRSYVVRKVEHDEVASLYEARAAVETHSAWLAAQLPAERLAGIDDALRRADIATTAGEAANRANRDIHRAVVLATENEHLLRQFDDLWGLGLFSLAEPTMDGGGHRTVAEEHADLVLALHSGSAERAAEAMREHVRGAGRCGPPSRPEAARQ